MNEQQTPIPNVADSNNKPHPEIVDNTEENARNAEAEHAAAKAQAADERPAEERIATLFDEMKTERKILLGILSFCEEGRDEADVNDEVARLTANHVSVYSPASLYRMLERAGAIAHEGGDAENQPELVTIDGVDYLKPADAEPIIWTTTEEGAAYAHADAPASRLAAIFAKEPQYQGIYLSLLERTAADEGATTSELDALVDDAPAAQEPKRFAEYFFEKLEDCDAIEWAGKKWTATDLGRTAIADLKAELG